MSKLIYISNRIVYYLVGVLLNVAAFVAVGPAIGAMIIVPCSIFVAMSDPRAVVYFSAAALTFYPVTFGLAYALTWKAAALTGAAVALGSRFITSAKVLYGLAAFLGGVTAFFTLRAYEGWELAVTAPISGASAALVCARLFRNLNLQARVFVGRGSVK